MNKTFYNDKIIMLVPSLEQPRIINRIVENAQLYNTVEVLAFLRNIHNIENYKKLNLYKNVNIRVVGSMIDGSYLLRPAIYLKLYLLILFGFGLKRKNLYVFGLDLRMFSVFIINCSIKYEISDIFWLYKPKITKRILRTIDYKLSKISNEVIFTSEGFYRKYYSFLNTDKVNIKENKFKSYSKVFPVLAIKKDKIRIAYLGAFRYREIIKSLVDVASSQENIILNFYGDGQNQALEVIKEGSILYNNIYFHGPFKNPDDLEKIYSENNLNFVAYDNKYDNEKVAMPNKFYESGYFNIPIVCSRNTFVGEKVIELGIGWVIDPTRDGIEQFLKNLTIDDLIKCHHSILRLDKTLFQL